MKIGLDLVNLTNLGEGLGRFAIQLTRSLLGARSRHEFRIFAREELAGRFAELSPDLEVHPVRTPRRRLAPWNQLYFLGGRHLKGLDLLHSPVSVSPLLVPGRVKRVLTVHDLAFKLYPATSSRWARAWWNLAWPLSLRTAAHVVTVSEQTKKDVMAFYSPAADRISVVHPYVSFGTSDVPAELIEGARDRYRLPRRYLLHVGAPHKRKNLSTLVRAFLLAKRDTSIPHGLVLAGPRGWDGVLLEKEIREAGLGDGVILTGFVPDEDLPGLYAGADILVFPSLYEGFGYPPLEAMACGTPVVASNVSSLPEVVGDAALLVPPESPEAIAAAVLKILRSPELSASLRVAGRRRVGFFSQERMARQYLSVYEKAVSAGSAPPGLRRSETIENE